MRCYAPILILCSIALCTATSFADSSAQSSNADPKPASVITGPIDESKLVTLTGNTTPAALSTKNDRGPVADSLRFDHLLLGLKPAPEAEARLEKLIDEMHRQGSQNFTTGSRRNN